MLFSCEIIGLAVIARGMSEYKVVAQMILYTTNIVAIPLLLTLWALDVYLFLTVVRLILGRIRNSKVVRVSLALAPLTDPLPNTLSHWLLARRSKPVPLWLPWLIVVFGCLILRHLLIWIVLKTF